MADRPILFSGPMILALLAGRKTQTRRVAKFVEAQENGLFHAHNAGGGILNATAEDVVTSGPDYAPISVGDRLWVRESLDLCRDGRVDLPIWSAGYRADGGDLDLTAPGLLTWVEGYKRRLVPSIHMPRSASRITLDVARVRVERIQDISDEDAIAEGIGPAAGGFWSGLEGQAGTSPAAAYAVLWNHINGPSAWEANPWVAAYTFRVTLSNIDRMEVAS